MTLAAAVAETIADLDVVDPVVLLAGMDSHAVLFALLDAGYSPTVATVRLGWAASWDAHLASTTADAFDLDYVDLAVPRGLRPPGTRAGWPFTYAFGLLGGRDYLTGHGITDSRYAVSIERERVIVAAHHREAEAIGGRFLAPLLDERAAELIPRPAPRGKLLLVDAWPDWFAARFPSGPPAHSPLFVAGGLMEVTPAVPVPSVG